MEVNSFACFHHKFAWKVAQQSGEITEKNGIAEVKEVGKHFQMIEKSICQSFCFNFNLFR